MALLSLLFITISGYPEDGLSSLENDILAAKAKQAAINEKLSSVQLAFDQEKSKLLQSEADRLMQELATEEKPKENIKEKIEKEIAIQAPLPQIQKKNQDFWKGYKINNQKVDLSESELLYRVAVSDNILDLKEAVKVGLASRMELKAYAQKVEVAKSKLTEARRALFPTVQGVFENYTGLSGQVGARTTGADAGNFDEHGRLFRGRSYKLNMSQPIFYDGELIFTMRQAEANLKAAKAEYEKTRSEYIHQVKVDYYGVVKSEYNVQYQRTLYEKVHDLYQKARQVREQKLIAEIDYLNVESLYQQIRFQTEASENDLMSAILTLSQVMGVDDKTDIPVDLKLKLLGFHSSLSEVVGIALERNPDMQLKNFGFEAAMYGVKIYQSKKKPKIDLRGSMGMLGETFIDNKALFDDGNADLDLEKEWFLGVESSMPIGPNSVEVSQNKRVFGPTVIQLTGSEDRKTRVAFNLLDKLSEITDEKSAQAALLEAQSDLDKAKADVTAKIRENYYALQKQMVQVDSTSAKIRYQEKQNSISEYMLGMQEVTTANYIEGLISSAEGRFAFIQAVTDYNLAISNLGLSMGDPDYFENETVHAKD